MRTRVVFSLLALIVLSLPTAAHAQFSVYGTISTSDYGYAFNREPLIISGDFAAYSGGLTYTFPHDGRLALGVEYRESVTPVIHGGSTGTASFRIGLVPRKVRLRPYFQVGGGYVYAKIPTFGPTGSESVTVGSFGFGGGLDLRITQRVDWRIIEIESVAGVTSAKSAGTASFGTGAVYHF
jgi:Outer membrane protein beta-barrel domain